MRRQGYGFFVGLLLCLMMTACAAKPTIAPVAAVPAAIHVECLAAVTADEAAVIAQAADKTKAYFEELGLPLEKSVTIVLTRNKTAYLAEVAHRFGISEIEAARVARGTDAMSGNQSIVVNVDGVPNDRRKMFLTAHELTHHYQRQIAGPQADAVKWILEGQADAIGAQVVARQGIMSVASYYANWQNGLQSIGEKPQLIQLRSREGWADAIGRYGPDPVYKSSAFAILVLTERFGEQQVLEYFRLLAQQQSPTAAFQKAFGLDLAEFETEITRRLAKAA